MDSLRYLDNLLIVCNDGLSTNCCASGQEAEIYWDAIHCNAHLRPRITCDEVDQCVFADRKYVSTNAYCEGFVSRICECQRLRIGGWSDISGGILSSVINATYSPPHASGGSINWLSDSVEIFDPYAGIRIISTTGTLQSVVDNVEALSLWAMAFGPNPIDPDLPASIIATGLTNFNQNDNKTFGTKTSLFRLCFNGEQTDNIEFDSDETILATRIQNELNNLSSINNQIQVTFNQVLQSGSDNRNFEILFTNGLCGTPQPPITFCYNNLLYGSTFNPATSLRVIYGRLPDRVSGWINRDQHTRLGSGSFGDLGDWGHLCPYTIELLNNELFTSTGPYPFDGSQCCPQKGTTLGPPQPIFTLSDGTSGYIHFEDFSNLENTVTIDGECYKIDQFFFIFGEGGRYLNNHKTSREPYIVPDCDFNNSDCASVTPCNCSVELFLPLFHKDIPWGPFGSYFPDIEDTLHAAYNYPTSYIATTFPSPERVGYDYRPQGYIKTRGTWLETKEIEVWASFHAAIPYYIGTEAFDDINFLGQIDPSSVSGTLTGNTGTGEGPVSFVFATSGLTVRDFVDAINNLRTLPTTAAPTGCSLFALCLASEDAGRLPASKIINVASELFDLATFLGYSNPVLFGADNPEVDEEKYSGSDIIVGPYEYEDLWPFKFTDETLENDIDLYFDTPPLITSPLLKNPPFCRHRTEKLPKETPSPNRFRNKYGNIISPSPQDQYGLRSPWWKAIQGCNETVINIAQGSGIPGYITRVDVSINDRAILINSTSGSTLINSQTVDTDKNGFTYTAANCVSELNNISVNSAGTIFWPVLATSGSQNFTIWLDDSTYWHTSTNVPLNSGDAGAVLTPHNWSYMEPLLDANTQNVLNDTLSVESFIRRRCSVGTYDNSQYEPLSGCVPPRSTKFDDDYRLDCESDTTRVLDQVVSYGCAGGACKTEWYLKTTRCNCSDEWDCATTSFQPHPYNHDGDSMSNRSRYSNNFQVTQPHLYICEYNFHPQCDIPMLVKVPFQIWGDKASFPTNSNGIGFECGQSSIAIVYGDGSHPVAELEYLGVVRCDDLPSYNFFSNIFNSECRGWCQYLDPSSGPRVQKEDIPQTWPPTAYVANRGNPTFCSVNPFSVDIEDICSASPASNAWDSIFGVIPWVPAEYLSNDSTEPCMMASYEGELRVITRPIVNPLTIGDLCGVSNDTRIDINCGTKCCRCEFQCNPSDSGVVNSGPFRCPCYQTITFSDEVSNQVTSACAFSNTVPECYTGCCINNNTPFLYPGTIGGIQTNSYIANATINFDGCCGCDNEIKGIFDFSVSRSSINCNGCTPGATYSYYDPCSASPAGNYCNNNDLSNCFPPDPTPITCQNVFTFIPQGTGSRTVEGVFTRHVGDTAGCQVANICHIASDFIREESYSETQSVCSAFSKTWDIEVEILNNGTSAHDGETLKINLGCDDFTTNLFFSQHGSYSQSEFTCASCPMGIQDSRTLPYITGWLFNADWICGYANLLRTTSTGVF